MPNEQEIEQNRRKLGDSEVDGCVGGTWIQIHAGLKESRRLHGRLFELAELAEAHPEERVALVLVDPVLSSSSIGGAWEAARRVIDKNLVDRMAVWIDRGRKWPGILGNTGFPSEPTAEERAALIVC